MASKNRDKELDLLAYLQRRILEAWAEHEVSRPIFWFSLLQSLRDREDSIHLQLEEEA